MHPPDALPNPANRTPLVEVSLAAVFAILFTLSPLSSGSRPMISVAMGCVFGVAFYAYRRFTRDAAVLAFARYAPPAERDRSDRVAIVGTVTLAVAIFLPTLIELYPWYTESVWRNGHGLFLPLLIFAVARVAIRDLGDERANGSPLGLALLIPGLLLVIADSGVHSIYLAVIGICLATAGLILTFLGPRWARALAPPTLMLLFFIPIASGLATTLEFDRSSAICTQWILALLGRPVAREGVILYVDTIKGYGISPRCAGFSIFYGALAMSVAIGAVVGSWKRALVLASCALPLTIFANGTRVALLILFCEWRGIDPSLTMLHGVSGIAAYLGVILAMLVMGGRTARLRLVAQ